MMRRKIKVNKKQDVKTMYEIMCETNDNIIKTHKKIVPVVVFIKDGTECSLHELRINTKNKKDMQERVKTIVEVEKMDAYIVISNAKACVEHKKTNEKEVNDCVVRTLYTPKEKISEIVWTKDGVILGKERFSGRQINVDGWDIWTPKITITINTDIINKRKVGPDVSRFQVKKKK